MLIKIKAQPKRKPGQRAGLTMEKILQTATDLIEKSGLDGFSLRHLAKELKVHPRAVQARFKGGVGMIWPPLAHRLLADLARPFLPEDNGASYIRDLFREALSRFHGRPMLARIIALTLSGDDMLVPRLTERVLVALRAGGLSQDKRIAALHIVMGVLIALISIEAGNSKSGQAEADAKAMLARIEALPKTEFPELVKCAQPLATRIVERVQKDLNAADRYADVVILGLKLNLPKKGSKLPPATAS
jgi:AcrR family transcriptional regulator